MNLAPLPPSPVVPTVDFNIDGVQHGFLRLPHSHDDSAWGSLMIPIAVVRNGAGPTALLTGANHGDEYEGPIALFDLARSLDPHRIAGTVIIVPAMNYPAFLAGTRTSPIDKGNMNRSFPGRPDGTPTQKIADYFQRELLPRADIVVDIHSGGRTLDFLPFAAAHLLPDKEQERRSFELVEAFSAPWSMRMLEIDPVGMYDTAAEELGKVFVTSELGGGGTPRAHTVGITKRGITNVLRKAGILEGTPEIGKTTWLAMPSDDCFCFAETGGLFEPLYDLGEPVEEGEVIARIHPTGRTGLASAEIRARMSGLVVGRHHPGLAKPGDCIMVVGVVEHR